SRPTPSRGPATCASRGPTSAGREKSWGTTRTCRSRTAWRARSAGTRVRRGPPERGSLTGTAFAPGARTDRFPSDPGPRTMPAQRTHSRRHRLRPPATDPVQSARAAGLHYVSDADPGIRRVRAGRGFRYVAPGGRPVRDAATLARIRSLVIPPAWADVWV